MSRHPAALFTLIAIWILPATGAARGAAQAREPALLAAQECPALFGDGKARARNAQRRAQLYWVEQEAGGVTVAHRSDDWEEPVPFQMRGVELRSARSGEASVELSAAAASALGCRAGRYRLRADDGLTRSVRVLALLDGVVLVEHQRRLAYLRAPGAREPRWLLAWSAPGEIRIDPEAAGSLGSDNLEPSYRHRIRSPYLIR
jgi:hypothetical protein